LSGESGGLSIRTPNPAVKDNTDHVTVGAGDEVGDGRGLARRVAARVDAEVGLPFDLVPAEEVIQAEGVLVGAR
jgi:hypothetical protein